MGSLQGRGDKGRLARNPPLPRDKNSVRKAEVGGNVLKCSHVASFRERTNTSPLQRNRDDEGRGGLRGGGQVALSPPEDRTSAPGLLAAAFPTVKDRREAARTAPRESQTTNSVEAGRARRQGLPMTCISGRRQPDSSPENALQES